jgi:hypothetical protein
MMHGPINIRTFIPSARLEPAMPAIERPYRTAIVIGFGQSQLEQSGGVSLRPSTSFPTCKIYIALPLKRCSFLKHSSPSTRSLLGNVPKSPTNSRVYIQTPQLGSPNVSGSSSDQPMGKQLTINYDTPKSWKSVTNEPDAQLLES